MNFKRITIIALAIFLLFSTSSFAATYLNTEIQRVRQDVNGIQITFLNQSGWVITRTVDDTSGIEKNILAIALTAQASGMNVDIKIDDGTNHITMIRIVSP